MEAFAASRLVGEDGAPAACLLFALLDAQHRSVRSFADTVDGSYMIFQNSGPRTYEEMVSGPRSLPPETL